MDIINIITIVIALVTCFFGYRLNNVFHITINDPDHEFNKL